MAEVLEKLPQNHPKRQAERAKRKAELQEQADRKEQLNKIRSHQGFGYLMEIIDEEIKDAENIKNIPDHLDAEGMAQAITIEKLLVKRLKNVKMNMKG